MILSGPEIERRIAAGDIEIDPFVPEYVGPNSIDIRLGDTLRVYVSCLTPLDSRKKNPTAEFTISGFGSALQPGFLYLGSTVERVKTRGLVPWMDGRSSIGRLGIGVHVTAGRGDDGFDGHFTLEITAVQPVIIYPGMRIAQVSFFELKGERRPYTGRYQGQSGPTASRFHQGEK